MNKIRLPVIEIFGPTIQGEGMVIGQKTMFVRTAGCDYSCSWCDSKFTWDGSARDEIKLLEPSEIWTELKKIGGCTFTHVTISGGNPALYPQLDGLIDLLHEQDIQVAIETQGSLFQEWFRKVDDLTLSPKPPSSGMEPNLDILDQIITAQHKHGRIDQTSLKIVIFDNEDLDFARAIHQRYPDIPFYLQTGNPDVKDENADDLTPHLIKRYEWLIDQVMNDIDLKNVRVLPQLHTLVWGNKRGV
ncbi:MAG: 7-carboxy-7-deazaguanine synthase QueE [Bacillaceae bacterium]|nr:7-carboxy-7-deazaguanine synthase QueE [Bacillaceae bacterium]